MDKNLAADTEYLDRFEKILQDGLVKLVSGEGIIDKTLLGSDDLESVWVDKYLKGYTADAIGNFNQYPDAALAWAAYLGMAVANSWDRDWTAHKDDAYESYYGSRGWDDMDEYIVRERLHLTEEYSGRLSSVLLACSQATVSLIRHEGIEAQTTMGFYVLVRAFSVMFRLGVGIELKRQGYRYEKLNKIC